MFLRLLYESFRRQRRRKTLAGLAILLGTTAVTAMLALALTIGDRIHAELAVYGANIVVTPAAANLDVKIGDTDIHPTTGNAYLHESDLAKLHTIFWANNITGVSPENKMEGYVALPNDTVAQEVPWLRVWFNHPFGTLTTGAPAMHPWWKLKGRWPSDKDAVEVAVGSHVAKRFGLALGDRFTLAQMGQIPPLKAIVTGIVTTGDSTDDTILSPLEPLGVPGLDRIEISARTKPEDAFARRDPATLSPAQHEIWYCRPYANSIAYQIQEAIPGAHAEQVRKVEQSEGTVLNRISGLMWLISAAALLAAGFAVSAAMATAILERRAEIGLMRSLGAAKSSIALLFYAETGILALIAGTLGYLLGSTLAAWLGARIFLSDATATNTLPTTIAAAFNPVLLPVTIGLSLLVAIAGSTPSIRTALRLDPANILRSDA
jgi:putative ABC transport system permease protein